MVTKFVYSTTILFLWNIFWINAEPVSLSGMVTKKGTTSGIADVKITCAVKQELSTLTGTDGSFSLGTTALRSFRQKEDASLLDLNGNTLHFYLAPQQRVARIEIFSSNGQRVFSVDPSRDVEGLQTVTLPAFSSGINILRLTTGARIVTRTILSVGNELLLEGEGYPADAHKILIEKQASLAMADTLIAEKTGYTTVRTPIDSYTKQDIAILMDTISEISGKCSREALQKLADGYVAALEAGDPSLMSTSDKVEYNENGKASSLEKGIWTVKIQAHLHREFCDVDSCKIFVEVVDNLSDHPYNIATQISVADGKIAKINALVADNDDWNLSAAGAFNFVYEKSSAESWPIISSDKYDDRATIKAAGDSYLNMFSEDVEMPWGSTCKRLEGNMYVDCTFGVPPGNLKMTDRQYVIDVAMGVVSVFCKFGGSMPDSHMLRLESGKIRFVHAVTIAGKN